jgi:ATP citrate (pro-S)-lyase
MEALEQPTIRVVAVIAEGVPEADTKKLIAYAREHNKILLGPATVGGIQALPPPPSHITSELGFVHCNELN